MCWDWKKLVTCDLWKLIFLFVICRFKTVSLKLLLDYWAASLTHVSVCFLEGGRRAWVLMKVASCWVTPRSCHTPGKRWKVQREPRACVYVVVILRGFAALAGGQRSLQVQRVQEWTHCFPIGRIRSTSHHVSRSCIVWGGQMWL